MRMHVCVKKKKEHACKLHCNHMLHTYNTAHKQLKCQVQGTCKALASEGSKKKKCFVSSANCKFTLHFALGHHDMWPALHRCASSRRTPTVEGQQQQENSDGRMTVTTGGQRQQEDSDGRMTVTARGQRQQEDRNSRRTEMVGGQRR